jgi:hypothetical protein
MKSAYTFNFAKDRLPDAESQRIYAHQSAILAATGAIVAAMERANVSRTELAAKLGKGPAFVSQILSGSRNMTLKTLSDFAWALDRQVREIPLSVLGETSVPYQLVDTWLDQEAVVRTVADAAVGTRDETTAALVASADLSVAA